MLSKEMCLYGFLFQKTPTEQLKIAYEVLEKAINDMNISRLMTILPDGKSIFDSCCTKVKFTESYTAQNLSVIYCILMTQTSYFLHT